MEFTNPDVLPNVSIVIGEDNWRSRTIEVGFYSAIVLDKLKKPSTEKKNDGYSQKRTHHILPIGRDRCGIRAVAC